jgi:hypothetical protein
MAIKRLTIALDAAREKGYLGKDILGSGLDFDVTIKQGAGAFVCGEETALFQSIEGKRGMPRIRPPFPAEKGLWQKPTNNNNVETYANVPWIVANGAAAYAAYGTEKSRGTKVFALAGKVACGGLAEVPMGMPINDLVFRIGGGIKDGRAFKAVQMGGPSGGCIPASLGHTPVDFESIPATGAIMGSGGMVVMDDQTCMVEMARFFLDFTQNESCGKCTFCRIGTLRMLEILTRITQGEGVPGDVEKLKTLATRIKESSLCGLGQTAPNPVLTTLKYFHEEYDAHIKTSAAPPRAAPRWSTSASIREVHRLHAVREELPGRRDRGGEEGGPRDRRREMRQVRQVHHGLHLRRRIQEVRERIDGQREAYDQRAGGRSPPDATILETVQKHGLDEIPTLCHSPELEPYASCFLCVVEVKGRPNLVPACATRVAPGMEVTTRNERIVESRKTALELLLSNHYADCVSPCLEGCPGHVDIQGYIALSAMGLYKEAVDLVREANPLPAICGRCLRPQVRGGLPQDRHRPAGRDQLDQAVRLRPAGRL